MITPFPSPQAPPAQQEAAAAQAAVAAVRAKLLALTLQAGQVLEAKVLGPAPGGMTRLALGGQTLTVSLPTPLPPGTVMQAQLQFTLDGRQPQLVLFPASASSTQQAPVLQPVAARIPPTAAPHPPVPGGPMPAVAVPPAAPSTPLTTIVLPLPAPATTSAPTGQAPQSLPPSGAGRSVAAPVAVAPAAAPQGPAATAPFAAASVTTPATPTAAPPRAAGMAAPPPAAGPLAPAPASPQVPTAPLAHLTAPPVSASDPMPTSRGPAAPSAPAAPPGLATSTATPIPPQLTTSASSLPAMPPADGSPRSMQFVPPIAAPQPPPAGSAAGIALGQATQAAARQDSIAPLLQNLAALQGRMASFPRPVAEAALWLLAGRLALGKTVPDPLQLKQAVLNSGVLVTGRPAAGAATDLRSGLLQLRSALLGFLGAEIAPVAPVSRRPPPPTRDAPLRGLRADPPSLPDAATPKDAGRTLLHQTDAALSRNRLLQLASLPPDAARAGAPPGAEWTLEVPMLLGSELAVAQLRIAGDRRNAAGKRGRDWRLQFSVNFSILGEVGAQIGFSDRRTSVALWAEEADTASALEAMLPELGSALAARGLEVSSLRVGRRAPDTRRPRAGQLLDGMR